MLYWKVGKRNIPANIFTNLKTFPKPLSKTLNNVYMERLYNVKMAIFLHFQKRVPENVIITL